MAKICDLEEIVRHMRGDGLGIYPTETFMALGCRAGSVTAVAGLYEGKRRPRHLPLPLIAADRAQVERIARIPPEAEKLMACFWPGPLSILLPASAQVPAASGTGMVAVRIPSHSGARDLAHAVGEPLVASSANISGAPPAKDVNSLDPVLLERVPVVWDTPPRPAGRLPSTRVRLLGGLCDFCVYCVKDGGELIFFYQVYEPGFGVTAGFLGKGANSDANAFAGFYFLEMGVEIPDYKFANGALGTDKPEHDNVRPLWSINLSQNVSPFVFLDRNIGYLDFGLGEVDHHHLTAEGDKIT
jgi:L-threonylcarbamoyladenylate synthase